MIKKSILAIIAITILGACNSTKKIAYLQGIEDNYTQIIDSTIEITLQPFDEISIFVNSKDPELAASFNLISPSVRMGDSSSAYGQSIIQNYTISKEGEINFPFLGKLNIEGMTRKQLQNYICSLLNEQNLLKDAIVTVRFANLNYSIMGEVARPGAYSITNDRITLLDAISKAGDLTVYGLRDNILLIREDKGKREYHRINLNTTDILSSPYFYLQQNDVIYIQPNKIRSQQRDINANNSIGTLVSVLSLLTTVAMFIFKK